MDEELLEDEPAFSAHAREVLERIYVEAHGPLKLGSPLLTLPSKSILKASDGKFDGVVFVELRTVIDLIKAGLPTTDDEVA
jgi:hypothetical protein